MGVPCSEFLNLPELLYPAERKGFLQGRGAIAAELDSYGADLGMCRSRAGGMVADEENCSKRLI